MKQTRARSKQAKEAIFKKTKETGRDLFLRKGVGGFTMRALAKELEMGSASLYTYVQSKRELWYAIIQDDFEVFNKKISALRSNHKGSNLDLIQEIFKLYFEEIRKDEIRSRMIFQTTPPDSKQKGPIEEKYELKIIRTFEEILYNAKNKGEIREVEPTKLAFFLWSLIYGNTVLTQVDMIGTKENLPEYGSLEEYYNFVLKKVKIVLEILK